MSNTLTIRLPEELSRWLDEEARTSGLPKSTIVKEQLERLRNAQTRQPFLDLAGRVAAAPGLSSKKGFSK
jgi:predicted transcriptional regulator